MKLFLLNETIMQQLYRISLEGFIYIMIMYFDSFIIFYFVNCFYDVTMCN